MKSISIEVESSNNENSMSEWTYQVESKSLTFYSFSDGKQNNTIKKDVEPNDLVKRFIIVVGGLLKSKKEFILSFMDEYKGEKVEYVVDPVNKKTAASFLLESHTGFKEIDSKVKNYTDNKQAERLLFSMIKHAVLGR